MISSEIYVDDFVCDLYSRNFIRQERAIADIHHHDAHRTSIVWWKISGMRDEPNDTNEMKRRRKKDWQCDPYTAYGSWASLPYWFSVLLNTASISFQLTPCIGWYFPPASTGTFRIPLSPTLFAYIHHRLCSSHCNFALCNSSPFALLKLLSMHNYTFSVFPMIWDLPRWKKLSQLITVYIC